MCRTEPLQDHRPAPVDPRLQVGATVAFALTAALVPVGAWAAFGLLAVLLAAVAIAARVPMRALAGRTLVVVPFLLAALPLAFTRPGPPLWSGWGLTVTVPGAQMLATVACRTLLSSGAAVLLALSTPFPKLLRGLLGLGISPAIVSTVSFMHRYSVVLQEEAARMRRAAASRSACPPDGRAPSAAWRAARVGSLLGSLFVRSLERSDRIHAAMLARGYDGRPRFLDAAPAPAAAPAWKIAAALAVATAAALWAR